MSEILNTEATAQEKESNVRLADNLNELMQANRIDAAELSHHTNIPVTTIHRLRGDTKSNPTISTLIPIANFFDVSLNQLIGEEELIPEQLKGRINPRHLKSSLVPIIDIDDVDEIKNTIYELVPCSAKLDKGAFALIATGSRTLSQFPEGTILIFNKTTEPKDSDYVVVRLEKKQKPTLRQLFIDGGDFYFKPVTNFGEIIASNDYEILGVMVQALMNYRNPEGI